MIITSVENKKIKEIAKLKDIKYIKKNKQFIVDGPHLVEEALKNSLVEELFVVENYEKILQLDTTNIKITKITDKVAKYLGDTVTNQGVFALCNIKKIEFDVVNHKNIVILDRVQDPGNLGTIIRTADAFGFDCVVIGKGSTSIYSQKALRSMQGSNFHIPCLENVDLIEFLEKLEGYTVLGTSLKGAEFLEDIDEKLDKVAVIFGNEGQGVSEEILERINKPIKIKMGGQAESLNVAISAGIILHYIKNILD